MDEEVAVSGGSPTRIEVKDADVEQEIILMTFPEAIKAVIAGKKVSKKEWDEKGETGTYGWLANGFLCLHKPQEGDEEYHPWTLNDGDLMGEDWYIYN